MQSIPRPYRIEWRPMAGEDLLAIRPYIGKDNLARARSFGEELRAKVKPLAQKPLLGLDWIFGALLAQALGHERAAPIDQRDDL
jgi:plasmid stabilization system protein ParE